MSGPASANFEPASAPKHHSVLAVVDETVPFVGGGVCYAVLSAILLRDEIEALDALAEVTAERRRPFHANREGPEVRDRMLAAMSEIGVVGRAIVVQCGRRSQEAARAVALRATVGLLLDDGCGRLVIETRSTAQNGRDQAVILDTLRERKAPGALTFTWEAKTNRILWIADAIGRAVHEHLTGVESDWYHQVVSATGLTVEYLPISAS